MQFTVTYCGAAGAAGAHGWAHGAAQASAHGFGQQCRPRRKLACALPTQAAVTSPASIRLRTWVHIMEGVLVSEGDCPSADFTSAGARIGFMGSMPTVWRL